MIKRLSVLLSAPLSLALGLYCGAAEAAETPQALHIANLLVEYRQNPIGIDAARPRLTWQLRSSLRDVSQMAYQIHVATSAHDLKEGGRLLFDSGKLVSSESTQVPYRGPPLQSRRRYYWQVRVWDNRGHSTRWSNVAYWEMGLLNTKDWLARWIEPHIDPDPMKSTPAPMLRSQFQLSGRIAQARAYVTSLGLYELYLNGKRVGDLLFTPGWTSFDKRLQYQTYDVTALLAPGANAVGVILGDGWYRRESFNSGGRHNNGKPLALLLQIEVTYENGQVQTIVTDGNWKASTGPILSSELYNGETYDARLERSGWATSAFDDHLWAAVRLSAHSPALIATVGPPVRRIEEISPVRIFKTTSGLTVADMGQNMVGWARLHVRGASGTTITLRHAETLDQDGDLYTQNLRSAQQTVRYILAGNGDEVLEPHFTVQGFRYVEIEGYPGEVSAGDLVGVVIHSDMQVTGSLETSNDMINQLQHNILWTQKGNYLEAPTDCPQRDERLGWAFDAAIFSATGALNMNVATFFSKWLGDLSADQTADGAVPAEIPRTLRDKLPLKQLLQISGRESTDSRLIEMTAAPGYGDAATVIPWNLYLAYGDVGILRTQYESMKRWVRYVESNAGSDFIWSPVLNFGDWLDVVTTLQATKFGATRDDLLATAFYAHSVDILQRTAVVIGERQDSLRYTELFSHIRDAFRHHFVFDDGRIAGETQTAYVLALDFDLAPESLRPRMARRLAEDVRARGYLTTGLAGTHRLLSVLSRFGYDREAYMLLGRHEMPSWLYSITHGATTVWERWDGIRPDGSFENAEMNSFNQGALGAIGEWIYGVMAGIALDPEKPGYRHSVIHPRPGGDLTHVRGSLETMYGLLSSEWTLRSDQFVLQLEVPPNSAATVHLPRATLVQVEESGRPLANAAPGIHSYGSEDGGVVVEIGSGRYQFTYPWQNTAADAASTFSNAPVYH